MRPGSDKLLAKAERAASIAASVLEEGAPEAAAGRAFYAMLYAAKVLLNEHGIRLRAHTRIAAALARVALPDSPPLHEWLAAAIERRRSGEGELTYEDAAQLVEQARQAVAVARARVSQ